MLSLPDFREKQILFIRIDRLKDYHIKLWNDNIRLYSGDEIKKQLSLYKILAVFIIGDMTITTKIIRKCRDFGVPIYFLKYNFDHYATVFGDLNGNYLLRQKQYLLSDQDNLDMAKNLIINKIFNQLKLLKDVGKLDSVVEKKNQYKNKVLQADNYQSLLGIEGDVSKKFYKNYFATLDWYKRMPRTKVDINNYLLDIGYTFLFNYIDSLLSLYGFDTYKGFYHKLFFQRRSLSCDLMEPFRCLIDKSLLKSFNLQQIDENDFKLKKGRYYCHYKYISKYTRIFFKDIIKHKEDIYIYIKEYYRFLLHNKGDFPKFNIR